MKVKKEITGDILGLKCYARVHTRGWRRTADGREFASWEKQCTFKAIVIIDDLPYCARHGGIVLIDHCSKKGEV
jgi:hypothetical protein